MAAIFDRAAPTYDAVGVDLFGPVAELLVAELAPPAGARALDVGCGRGAVLWPLAEAVGPTGRVVGIDLSPAMVAAAQADADRRGLAVEIVEGDATAPAFAPGSFDVLSSSLVLFFLPEPGSVLATWRELLAEGGRVGVTTFGSYGERWQAVEDVFAPWQPRSLRDPRTTGAQGPFASDEGMEALLAGAGFAEVRTVSTVVPIRFTDVDHWHRWTWSTGQRAMWEAIPEENRDEVRALGSARVEGARLDDGALGFDQVVRVTLGRR